MTQANDCLESGAAASKVLGNASLTLNLTDEDFGRLLTYCVIRTADFVVALRDCSATSSKQTLLSWLEHAQNINRDLEHWRTNLPAHWKFSRRQDHSWTDEYALDHRCDGYYDIQVASNWNCYRRTRLILLDSMVLLLDYLTVLGEQVSMLKDQSHTAIMKLSEDFCGSVPFHLGTKNSTSNGMKFPTTSDLEGDAVRNQTAPILGWFLIVLPMRRFLKSESIPGKHRDWLKLQYERVCAFVGKKHGITKDRAARILETAIPAFASLLPINSRHIR